MKLFKIILASTFLFFSFTGNSISKSCSSDFSCGMGYTCVKQPFKMSGTCMKTVNNYGVRTYNSPSTNSIGVKTSGSCTFNTDCSIGFKCDRKYKECIKR